MNVKTSLLHRGESLARASKQLVILVPHNRRASFTGKLKSSGIDKLRADRIEILQVNLGKLCNMACAHCHVDAGPDRREIMDKTTADACLNVLRKHPEIRTLDLAGGDGTVATQGVSPFRYPPDQVLAADADDPNDRQLQRLAVLRNENAEIAEVLNRVHFRDLPTIYPPTSQLVFYLVALTTPGDASVAQLPSAPVETQLAPPVETDAFDVLQVAESISTEEKAKKTLPDNDPSLGVTTFLKHWEMNDFIFMVLIENLKPNAAQKDSPPVWFSETPLSVQRLDHYICFTFCKTMIFPTMLVKAGMIIERQTGVADHKTLTAFLQR